MRRLSSTVIPLKSAMFWKVRARPSRVRAAGARRVMSWPWNFHLRRLAEKVKEGIRAAGGTPMEFNTISISDGVTMGTEGMKASLVSREIIADSIELVCRGHLFDAVVALVGCDKTIPGAAMALLRLDLPALLRSVCAIAPGMFVGKY